MKPSEKVSLKDVADVMRDHFEGSPMDMTVDAGAGGHHTPYRWRPMEFEYDGKTYVNERAIATQQTGFWIVCQSRSWLPDEIGGVIWFGTDDAATSCLTPVYTTVNEIPGCIKVGNGSMLEYSPTSLFWVTNRIANFAYMLYDRIEPEVREVIDARENTAIEEQPEIDAAALKILGETPTEESIAATPRLPDQLQHRSGPESVRYMERTGYLPARQVYGRQREEGERARNIPQ